MIRQFWINLVGLLLIFIGTVWSAETKDLDFNEALRVELLKKAKAFQHAMANYFASPEGRAEFEARNNLRQAYLSCDADYEVIMESGANYGDEVMRKINEWQHKVELGLLLLDKPPITLEEFDVVAAQYEETYNAVRKTHLFAEYQKTHNEFKDIVLKLLDGGITPKAIDKVLHKGGIHDERVLSRPGYWDLKREDF